ncbi:MAG: UDP-N-acetylglucosamine 1-carboxyvinyltransferase [Wolinella sp.]
MDFLSVQGRVPLGGEVEISGAKNAALPLISATLLAKNRLTLSNIPDVMDIKTLLSLLEMLGAEVEYLNAHEVRLDSSRVHNTKATYDIVRKMRASILVLGALLSRFGRCEVSLPGGCAIGARPVDLHIRAMEKMGAEVEIKQGYIVASAPRGLKGARIAFDKITVTGTENVLMAAALAHGKTHILNAAIEPEVVQLCEMLQSAGVEIAGIGGNELEIIGHEGEALEIPPLRVIPDRIEAGTYLCVGAIANSALKVRGVIPEHLQAMVQKFEEIGFGMQCGKDWVSLTPAAKRRAFEITTTEYPGFPTDMQAQFMALATQCEGASIIEERLFENRFMHVSELQRLGAEIHLKGNIATVHGASKLLCADVMATDLRASSALVLAALVADGVSNIHRIYHLDRGYEKLEQKLGNLGAKITRGKE